MRKASLILIALLVWIVSVSAQQFHIEKSVPFDEPGYGWNKILQLKNGNTFFFHSTKKDGIDIVVYDKSRKVIAKRNFESKLWDAGKMKRTTIKGLYEINGEPCLFVMQEDGREPTLYLTRLNPNTGFIVKEAELGNLPKLRGFDGFALAYGNVTPSDIIVEKDPESDCYTTIFFNGLAHETDKRIRVVHYDGTHKKINEAFYQSPDGAFKYLRYIGAVVDGSKRVYLATYGFNAVKGGDEASRVIVSKLNVGETTFSHKLLDFSEDFNDTKSVMLYNHGNNQLQLLTVTALTKSGGFSLTKAKYFKVLLSHINAETLALIDVKPVDGALIDAYGKKNIEEDYEFRGMPQNMILNKDNTTTILSEYTETDTRTDAKTGRVLSVKTILGPIGVSELSADGTELHGYAISKRQQAEREYPKLYISNRSKGIFAYPKGGASNVNQFMSYDYINTEHGRYIIFNDLPRNVRRDEDKKRRKIMIHVSGSNTVAYKLGEEKTDEFYLFGDPEDKKNAVFCYIDASHFNKDINTYATLIVEQDGRDKEARVAWITFE